MIFTETALKGAFLIDLERRDDDRGFFARAFCQHEFEAHGLKPVIAQMNIGSEEAKGTDIIKATRDLLKATPGCNYIGYIEGREFFDGVADVVVTDGFVGNTLLKMAEGMAKSFFAAILQEIFTRDADLALRMEPVLKGIYKKSDYHEVGGAPLLGVNGTMIIAHGSSIGKTITSAIRKMREFVTSGVNEAIVARLAEVSRVGALAHVHAESETA